MICGGYPPKPCPPTHTGHPEASSVHGGTAFTGPDLFVPIVALMFCLLLAALALVLSRAIRRSPR